MRLSVVGTSCSGKTTLARRASEKLGVKFIEQDRLFWRPGWVKAPREEFMAAVHAEIEAEGWTICGNYSYLRDEVWARATHIVWLNYPFPLIFWWALKRTVWRGLTGGECCNGNRESLWRAFLTTDSILWWVITSHRRNLATYSRVMADGSYGNALFLEFRRPRDAERWLASLDAPAS